VRGGLHQKKEEKFSSKVRGNKQYLMFKVAISGDCELFINALKRKLGK
jgi:hypothetical protein